MTENTTNTTTYGKEINGTVYTVANLPVKTTSTGKTGVSLSSLARAERMIAREVVKDFDANATPEAFTFVLKALGLNGKKLAKLLGVGEGTVSSWRKGHKPVPKYAWSFLAALGATTHPKNTANLLLEGGDSRTELDLNDDKI